MNSHNKLLERLYAAIARERPIQEKDTQHPPTGCYANGVTFQSPVSRSARWVTSHPYARTPTGFHKRRQALQ